MHSYTPRGVCSRQIDVEVNGDTVESVQFTGGCDGNLKAISKLVAGMKVDDVAALLEGNTCGRRSTSCADQMVRALREAQAEALNLRATGMAVAIDVGEAKDIHPKNKQEVARRLALLALDKTYGRKVVSEAPAYAGYSIENGKIYVSFNTGAREFAPETGAIDGFVIAGHDGRFYKGEARREGDRIVVSSPDVEFPVAVR